MEMNSITKVEENGSIHESEHKRIGLSKPNIMSHDLVPEKKDLMTNGNKSNKNVKFGVIDELLFVLKSVPKDNLPMTNNQLDNKFQSENNDVDHYSESKDLILNESKQNLIVKPKPKDEPSQLNNKLEQADALKDDSLNMRFDLEDKTFDLIKEPKKEILANNHSLNNMKMEWQSVSHDNKLLKDRHSSNPSGKCLKLACSERETCLEKIPKDILGNYGIIIEDCDGSKSPELENRTDLEDDVEDEGDGKLIIDEEEVLINNTERTSGTSVKKSDISDETEDCTNTLTAKENTSGFTNCGHNLVISSVTSLQWIKQCNICYAVLPDVDSLENHKKGHCSFPGCQDFIENDSEMEKHLQVHKAHPVKPFRCEYCKKRFHYYRFSKKHRDMCKVLKRSKCPYCKYSTSKIVQYNKHVAKHVNKMTCTDCRKSYILVKKYSKHLYVHHRKQVLFQCTECPRRFILPENIIEHVQKTHKLTISDCGLSRFIQVHSTDEANNYN